MFDVNSVTTHCVVGFCVRLLLIIYGEIQDRLSSVQYTDIDYRVFTDAARYMLDGKSPFDRHTYRYTPLLASLLMPNIFFHPAWGKFVFSIVDVSVGWLVYVLVLEQGATKSSAVKCATTWLYNPMSIIISTRGNCDSISAALVLSSLLLLQQQRSSMLVGAIHGFAVHLRLYPIAFSLAMYLALQAPDSKNMKMDTTPRRDSQGLPRSGGLSRLTNARLLLSYYFPSWSQLLLAGSCVGTLVSLTACCYWLYGDRFLQESLLYHLSRHDIRHNFSVYFYQLYLNSVTQVSLWQRSLTFLPQAVLLITLSYVYGSRHHLPFCLLTQAIVMVSYNPVLTSQYFIWFLSLLPPCLPNLAMTAHQAVALVALWFCAQLAWLLPAYWLEFQGRDTFIYIWLQGIAFFCANMAVLARLIRAYQPSNIKNIKSK